MRKCEEVGVQGRGPAALAVSPSPPPPHTHTHTPATARNASCRVYVALALVTERMFIATIMETRPDRGESEPCVMVLLVWTVWMTIFTIIVV